MANLTYRQNISRPGYYSFTMPEGFETTMEIHLWGAGGGNSAYALGAGGGYAKSIVTVAPGDLVEIGVGSQGKNSSGQSPGKGGYSFLDLKYSGGDGGTARDEDNDTGPGAGGGAASAVLINSLPVCVAAGGGGGSGFGDDLRDGNPGKPGGIYTTLTANTRGGNGGPGGSGGGGGGGGYLGGLGGAAGGDDRPAGQGGNGGQNFGNTIISGSGVKSGGIGTVYDPIGDTGFGTYSGYAVIILTRKFQIYSKDSGTWKEINNAYVKQSGTWKTVSQVYIKNAGE